MQPFFSQLDLDKGELLDVDHVVERKLSDVVSIFKSTDEVEAELEKGDPVVYRVFQRAVPKKPGQLQHSTTVIYPGAVGGECYMTKGHYHTNPESAEIYIGLRGTGLLLMQKGEETEIIEMNRGVVAYIPPGWAHRTINYGNEPFVFMSVFPGDAGYDYDQLTTEGINLRIYKTENGYKKVRD